jgi:hypothetical protein
MFDLWLLGLMLGASVGAVLATAVIAVLAAVILDPAVLFDEDE